jgi:hypothetical protein
VPSFRNAKHCKNFSDRHWYQTSYCMMVVWPTPPVSTSSNGTRAHAIKSIKKWDRFPCKSFRLERILLSAEMTDRQWVG